MAVVAVTAAAVVTAFAAVKLSATPWTAVKSSGGGRTARRGLCEQQRLTVIPPIVTLVIAVVGRTRHGQQHEVMIRRTLQLPALSCGVVTSQEETSGPQYAVISTQ